MPGPYGPVAPSGGGGSGHHRGIAGTLEPRVQPMVPSEKKNLMINDQIIGQWPLLVAPSRPCRGRDAPPGRGPRDFSLLGKSRKTKSANASAIFWPNFPKFEILKKNISCFHVFMFSCFFRGHAGGGTRHPGADVGIFPYWESGKKPNPRTPWTCFRQIFENLKN